jgi:RNA polymerase sigma factor (sigma-70 family)
LSFLTSKNRSVTDDDTLVNRFRLTGDLHTLAELYERFMDLCYAVCLKYLQDSPKAQDAVMDIFYELSRSLPRHEVKNFRGWLYTVAKNHCLMKLRLEKNNISALDDGNFMQLADETHHEEDNDLESQIETMNRCIERLSNEQREAVELFYKQNKCYNEISSITGRDWNKVRSLIQNARRNLKICMKHTLEKVELKNVGK